jgi:hypothetical protein
VAAYTSLTEDATFAQYSLAQRPRSGSLVALDSADDLPCGAPVCLNGGCCPAMCSWAWRALRGEGMGEGCREGSLEGAGDGRGEGRRDAAGVGKGEVCLCGNPNTGLAPLPRGEGSGEG